MTWSKVSDDLHSHPKWVGISPNAKALWCTALSYSNSYLTNGVVDDRLHRATVAVETFAVAGGNPLELYDVAAAELVEAKLWRRRTSSYVFHQWEQYQPRAEDEKHRKERNRRRHELHNTAKGRRLKAHVIERDAGRCRYCGCETSGEAGTSASRQFDHVDPNGPNTAANVVLSCGRCNRRKANRTLEDAAMLLLDADIAERVTDRVSTSSASAAASRSRGRVGSGRVGTGADGTGADWRGQDTASGASDDLDPTDLEWLNQQATQEDDR